MGLLIFLHSQYSRLDHDISVFYGANGPPALLLTETTRCPELLREEFIVLSPECPVDAGRCGSEWLEKGYSPVFHGSVWLRKGYDPSYHVPEMEEALMALI